MASDVPDATPPQPGFKRLNFFKGLVTYYTDWIDNESYRLGKHRWHNQRCHGPGVVAGFLGELRVSGRGDLSIEVQPGCAIDGAGNEILLASTQIKHVRLEDLKLPQTVYIVVRYAEELSDFISYKNNLAIRGHRRVLEGCAIEITPLMPNIATEVEIARVLLDRGVTAVRDPGDPQAPKPNEIDLRHVVHAGYAGTGLDWTTQMAVTTMLAGARESIGRMSRVGRVAVAQDALHAAIAMSTMHMADFTNPANVLEMLGTLFELQVACYVDIKLNHARLTRLPQWDEWVSQLRLMQRFLTSPTVSQRDRVVGCINAQHHINDIVAVMFAPKRTG
jgi:hypothetical protein